MPAAPSSATPAFWKPILALLAGAFITVVDNFIVNIAIPSMKGELGASFAEIQLIVAGYSLAYGMMLVTGGRLGDLYGRKRCYLSGLAGFTLASLFCGIAPGPTILIAGRLMQGASAALLFPQVLALLRVLPAPERRPLAFALLGAAMGLGAIVGQLAGGLLVTANLFHLGWRPIFLVNLPIGAAVILAALRLVPEPGRAGGPVRLDLAGVALATISIAVLLLPLILGREAGWPLWSFLLLASAVPLGFLFVALERRIAAGGGVPLLDLSLFRSRPFVIGLCLAALFHSTANSFYLSLSLFLQMGLKAGPVAASILFLPIGIAFLAASLAALRLARHWGARVLDMGALLAALGYALLGITPLLRGPAVTGLELEPALILAAIGQGLFLTPMINTVLSRVEASAAGSAAGILATLQQVGGSLGVAVVGILFFGPVDGTEAGYRAGLAGGMTYTALAAAACFILLRLLAVPAVRRDGLAVRPAE